MSIKDWNKDERPREKLIEFGPQVLSLAELLAILIGSGTKQKSALELSKELLNVVDNKLFLLGRMSVDDLKRVKGIGTAKAVILSAALELGRRRLVENMDIQQISSSSDAADLFFPLLSDLPHEEFWSLFLTNANTIISKMRLSRGSDTATIVDVKELVRNALLKKAKSVIVVHNHPSGKVLPGTKDLDITEKIKKALSFFDIKLLDHIIIGYNKFYSFADEMKL